MQWAYQISVAIQRAGKDCTVCYVTLNALKLHTVWRRHYFLSTVPYWITSIVSVSIRCCNKFAIRIRTRITTQVRVFLELVMPLHCDLLLLFNLNPYQRLSIHLWLCVNMMKVWQKISFHPGLKVKVLKNLIFRNWKVQVIGTHTLLHAWCLHNSVIYGWGKYAFSFSIIFFREECECQGLEEIEGHPYRTFGSVLRRRGYTWGLNRRNKHWIIIIG